MLMSGSSPRTRARDSRIRRWSSTSSPRTGRGLAALSERVTGPGTGAARSPRDADASGDLELTAWSPSGDGPRRALDEGVVDAVAGDPAIALGRADLIVLAGPPLACIGLVERLGGDLREALAPGATVTD